MGAYLRGARPSRTIRRVAPRGGAATRPRTIRIQAPRTICACPSAAAALTISGGGARRSLAVVPDDLRATRLRWRRADEPRLPGPRRCPTLRAPAVAAARAPAAAAARGRARGRAAVPPAAATGRRHADEQHSPAAAVPGRTAPTAAAPRPPRVEPRAAAVRRRHLGRGRRVADKDSAPWARADTLRLDVVEGCGARVLIVLLEHRVERARRHAVDRGRCGGNVVDSSDVRREDLIVVVEAPPRVVAASRHDRQGDLCRPDRVDAVVFVWVVQRRPATIGSRGYRAGRPSAPRDEQAR